MELRHETGPWLAFHNDAALQAKMLTGVAAHVAADQVVQREYGKGEGKEFRGCFIGCTVHALKGEATITYNDVQAVFEAYGFPAPLTRICEKIFEGVPAEKAAAFFESVPNALKLGADLSLVHWKFLDWMLRDTMEKYGTPEVRKGCKKALSVVADLAKGKKVTEKRANAAHASNASNAAYAVYAAYAAHAAYAVYAAYAANAAAFAAADAANAAAFAAADAAARYEEFAAKMLEILEDV
jgi:hypothetical protein